MSASQRTASWEKYKATRPRGDSSREPAFNAGWEAAESAERDRCVAIVQAARCAEIDQDWRAVIAMIEGGSSAEDLIAEASDESASAQSKGDTDGR